jgi:tetratricopeptide (TPR) repeat protein
MILNNLAYADYQLKRYQEAEMAALRAVSIEPLPDLYWNLCKIVTAQRRYGDALKYCNEAKDRGIQKILYPGKRGGGSKAGDKPAGDNPPPPPDAPPGPDGPPGESRGKDLKGPASNDDEAAENAPEADPEDSIIGQIGKRDKAGDQRPPKKPHFDNNEKPLAETNAAAAEWVGHWEGDKVMGCIKGIEQGVNRTHIVNGTVPHPILLEIFTDKGIGTMVTL